MSPVGICMYSPCTLQDRSKANPYLRNIESTPLKGLTLSVSKALCLVWYYNIPCLDSYREETEKLFVRRWGGRIWGYLTQSTHRLV